MGKSSLPLGLLLFAFDAVGCAGGCREGETTTAVWSDDGTAFGLLIRTYETRPGILFEEQSYLRSRVTIEDPASGDRTSIGDEAEDLANDPRLYFMRRRGYFLFVARVSDRGELYRQVRTDGTTKEVPGLAPLDALDCPGLDVVPSPDGTILARVRSMPKPCPGANTSSASTDIDFYDADSLAPIGEPSHLELPAWSQTTWTPRGDFLVVAQRLMVCSTDDPSCVPTPCLQAWRVSPQAAPEPTVPPGCTEPRTTSGPISATGAVLQVSEDGEVGIAPGAVGTPFGCQDGPSPLPRCPDR